MSENFEIHRATNAFQFFRRSGIATPLEKSVVLSQKYGGTVYIKHEECNNGGSFKTRSGLYYLSQVPPERYRNGVVCATRGNFGIGIALAAEKFGCKATVFVPTTNVREKNDLIQAYGAEIIAVGRDFDEAKEQAEVYASRHQSLFISTADDPNILHATAGIALEIFLDLPQPDYIVVPIGSGSLAAGIIGVRNALSPKTQVIGVQAARANVVYQSWKAGDPCQLTNADTIADGLATRNIFDLPFRLINQYIDDILTLEEEEIEQALYCALKIAKLAVEPASATVFGCLEKVRGTLYGKTVVVILTGRNFAERTLVEVLNKYADMDKTGRHAG